MVMHLKMHSVWRRLRRPFRLPVCPCDCTWEVYDVDKAGCLRCGAHHQCILNSVDCQCPLAYSDTNDNRVCTITGAVVQELHTASREFSDGVSFSTEIKVEFPLETHIDGVVRCILQSKKATRCRIIENKKLYDKLQMHFFRQLREFKTLNPGKFPQLQHAFVAALSQEKYWHFIHVASENLVKACVNSIHECVLDLIIRKVKISVGQRLRDIVCGLIYMSRNGLAAQNRILLRKIPDIHRCLPHENKLETYFSISSKVICMTENEIKYTFRDHFRH
jgi:hypothetical protein